EIRNPNLEIRNKFEIRSSNDQNGSGFEVFGFRYSDLFRISIFGFRICSGDDVANGNDGRLVSLDAYRGFVMLAMVSSGLGMGHLLTDPTWGWLADQFTHRDWVGCTFWDLIQPSFMLIVGVAMVLSFGQRAGQPWGRQLFHVVKRC